MLSDPGTDEGGTAGWSDNDLPQAFKGGPAAIDGCSGLFRITPTGVMFTERLLQAPCTELGTSVIPLCAVTSITPSGGIHPKSLSQSEMVSQ